MEKIVLSKLGTTSKTNAAISNILGSIPVEKITFKPVELTTIDMNFVNPNLDKLGDVDTTATTINNVLENISLHDKDITTNELTNLNVYDNTENKIRTLDDININI